MLFSLFFFLLLSTSGAVTEDACPPTEVVKFAKLYMNPHVHSCQKVSANFSMTPPKGYPTDPQIKAMCGSNECRALIKDVFALEPANCLLSFAGVKLNAYKMASSVQDACDVEKSHKDDTLDSTSNPVNNSISTVTEGAEQSSTPKPTKQNEQNSTLSNNDRSHLDEPMVIKNHHGPKKENATEAGSLMPPLESTAFEMFPTPDTTYKATVPPAM